MEPECVNVDGLLVLELERPLASVLVLRIFPLGPYTLLEEMVVRFERKVGRRGDVVLRTLSVQDRMHTASRTYVDAPELLDRVKRDDLLQQICPVVALRMLVPP